eukprot:TRINITY_DN20158_c0_g1_i1.p1 TRINITY_DN20158_c0_g1~~TRINITY_DN20158_c0_g1_i1.p1  ORF type:complete len:473 (+),score=79.40 TRINITY_DN20158_c0_g1_i1:95-1513(+)
MLLVELAVFLIVLGAGVCRAVAAIGAALVIQVCWLLISYVGLGSGSMVDATAFIILSDAACFSQAWILRKHFNWRFVAVVAVPWTILEILGTRLLIAHGESAGMMRAFGLFLFLLLVWQAWTASRAAAAAAPSKVPMPAPAVVSGQLEKSSLTGNSERLELTLEAGEGPSKVSEMDMESAAAADADAGGDAQAVVPGAPRFDVSERRNFALALSLGVGGGILKGVFSVPLPALSAFVLASGIGMDEWRSNATMFTSVVWPMKAWYFFVMQGQCNSAYWPLYISATGATFAGLYMGNWLSDRLKQDHFVRFVRAITFAGACSYCMVGTRWAPLVTFLAGAGATGWELRDVLYAATLHAYKGLDEEPEQEHVAPSSSKHADGLQTRQDSCSTGLSPCSLGAAFSDATTAADGSPSCTSSSVSSSCILTMCTDESPSVSVAAASGWEESRAGCSSQPAAAADSGAPDGSSTLAAR